MSISGETIRNILIALVLTLIGLVVKGGLSAFGQAGSIFGGVASIFSAGGGHRETPIATPPQQMVQAPAPQPAPAAQPQVIYIIQPAPAPATPQAPATTGSAQVPAVQNVQSPAESAAPVNSESYTQSQYAESNRYAAPYHRFRSGDYLPGYGTGRPVYEAGPAYAPRGFRSYPSYRVGPPPMAGRPYRGFGRPMRGERRFSRAY